MPFRLKNVGATYQRLVNHMFFDQIGKNVEVYVDDMLVKSKDEANNLDDLKETFSTLRKYNMKLNPAKCVFVVALGKFLGFIVSQRGLEANPNKVKAQPLHYHYFCVASRCLDLPLYLVGTPWILTVTLSRVDHNACVPTQIITIS